MVGRRRLRDADELRMGQTVLVSRGAAGPRRRITVVTDVEEGPVELSPVQQRVLVALCRPFAAGATFARPASNREVAEELCLSVAAVKTHLRALFHRFGIESLPQNEKRAELVRRALKRAAVALSDLNAGH